MSVQYEIKADSDQVQEALTYFKFVGGNTDRAVSIAINRSLGPIRTKASEAIRTQVRLKAGYVKNRLVITKSTRRTLSGSIKTPSRGILMTKYVTDTAISNGSDGPWQGTAPPAPPRGIRVKIKPSGGTLSISSDSTKPTPFYMKFRNGYLGVVRRKTSDEITAKSPGAVKVYKSPSLSQVFNTVREEVLPEAGTRYQKELIDAMNYVLKQQYPPES